ncbi:MAG: hypothetical protein M0P39_00375 [Rhodocyclaceae bacterium]|nr:hypothetical protein [Rhodocyclaceae bacterium]
MKIASATLSMQASHQFARYHEESESLKVWVGTRAAAANPAPSSVVHLSPQAQAASMTEEESDPRPGEDARLTLIRQMIEMLTGRPIRLLTLGDLQSGTPPIDLPAPNAAAAQPAARVPAGYGIEYDYHAVESESEWTTFSASGTIQTADGRALEFSIDLSMRRSFSRETNISLRAGDAVRKDPLVINFDGTAAQLADQRFGFDLFGDGNTVPIAQLTGQSGYLALDRNGNGRIDDGRELFGPASGSGFAELGALDQDGNGWIDENDAAFAKLRIWSPDGNGRGELSTLARHGVGALFTGQVATPFDLRGNANSDLGRIAASGLYLGEDGRAGTLQEVDLSI